MEKIDAARSRIGPATPASTGYYVEYQRRRILQNWRTVINGIPDAQRNERRATRAKALVGGKTLDEAARKSRNAIPDGHFLRQRIVAQDG